MTRVLGLRARDYGCFPLFPHKKLNELIALRVQLDLARGTVPVAKVPHDLVIENSAHQVGRMVSRRVQQADMNDSG